MKELLPTSFYQQHDVLSIAKQLLGKRLYTNIDGVVCGGIIVETEAYRGPEDRGSHAFNDKRTPRNEMMFAAGGVAYMYICYGIHDMLNIVTGSEGSSHAILIRALQPLVGLDAMRFRRKLEKHDTRLCQGPGALGQALGLSKIHNGASLQGPEIWIENEPEVDQEAITCAPRVGMNFDGPYKSIPWRFYLKGNKFVSKPNK